MFDDEEAAPVTNGDRCQPKDCVGHLLLVWSKEYVAHSPTVYTLPGKQSDLIVVDIVNLDEADERGYQGKVYEGSWWRQGRLIRDLRPRIGRAAPMVARMGVGVATKGLPPFELTIDYSPDARQRATAWLEAHPDFRPNRDAAMEIIPQTPPRQPSQLEALAQRQAGALRTAMTPPPPPPPPPPPARPAQTEEPPF